MPTIEELVFGKKEKVEKEKKKEKIEKERKKDEVKEKS